MAQDNRGYYPTDSLHQEQTEFYNEYPSYQYPNDNNHYNDEDSDQVVEKSVYVNYSSVNINGTIGSRGSPSRSTSGFPLRDSPLIRVNPNPGDHVGPQYRGAHFAYHEDNFINMHHNKHSLLQPQYNTYGLPRKSASNPLLRIPSDLMSNPPAPKPAPLQNTRNGANNAQQKPANQKPDSMEDFSRDLEAELNKLLQDDGDDDSTASLQESDSISRSHLSSTNSSRGNLFSPFITDAGSQTEDEAVTPNGVIYDPYWEAQASPSNHSSSGLVPRAASWGQLNTSSLYVNVNSASDELSAVNSPHRIALSPQTRNLGLGSRPQGPGMSSGHQRSASLGTVNIKNTNVTPVNQLITPLITPPSTTPPQSLTLSNDLFDPLDSSSDSNTRLFFKALPPELDNYPFLLQTFIKYGDVKSLTCNSKRRFALVEFGTRDEAMLAKRECKKIQGPSGEVYRLKIFWGKDFVDIKQRKSKGSLSPSHSPNQHPDMLNHVMYNHMDEHLIGAPPNMTHYPVMNHPWYATPAYSDGL